MNRLIIDLHGLTEQEAISKLGVFLWEFEEQGYEEAEIITGNGIVLKGVAEDMIKNHGFNTKYEHGNNGAIIIYK